MGNVSKIDLIPWDPDSLAHRTCLRQQRVECSWHQEKVDTVWREEQTKGDKCIYWIVLSSDESYEQTKSLLDETKPQKRPQSLILAQGNGELQDTATSINAVAREPSQQSFVPIGHISLDSKNADASKLDLDLPQRGVYWVKTFFVSHSFQSQGIGRAAMDEVETMAVQEPLCAQTLMLDTVQKDDQRREDFSAVFYGDPPKITNEEWYARRDYRLVKTVQNYYGVVDKTGKVWDVKTVFMRRDLV
ncbi:hypothetical protein N7492_001320 [Penicillium capsulatum]|uniref:N-acetyltransferase domain-containing protein n=1 Tax=Penicillium capsulatum TaxID=69766 RepID=A0A9W9IRD6_9EURO|nr:hypothetical protein N7492_001320 [Penicillium capsulatum]KAJ6129621.1 hypothetical protein N7512_002401 [Penicillium capsulatum]